MTKPRGYQTLTAAGVVRLIEAGTDQWLAIGQFLDDWRCTPVSGRIRLVTEPPPIVTGDTLRWSALLAAAVEWLCRADGLPFPSWTSRPEYRLTEPWFLYPGWRLRAWQLVDTPAPFKMRNIFTGDRVLSRV